VDERSLEACFYALVGAIGKEVNVYKAAFFIFNILLNSQLNFGYR